MKILIEKYSTEKLVENTGESDETEKTSCISSGSEKMVGIKCKLETIELWEKFHELGTEMIITKSGRWVFFYTYCLFYGVICCLTAVNGGWILKGKAACFIGKIYVVEIFIKMIYDKWLYRYYLIRDEMLKKNKKNPLFYYY